MNNVKAVNINKERKLYAPVGIIKVDDLCSIYDVEDLLYVRTHISNVKLIKELDNSSTDVSSKFLDQLVIYFIDSSNEQSFFNIYKQSVYEDFFEKMQVIRTNDSSYNLDSLMGKEIDVLVGFDKNENDENKKKYLGISVSEKYATSNKY